MARSVRANFGSVVRAGESYHGKQGLDYTPGVSAESVGSEAIWLGSVTLPPHGGRTKAHLHENHETALYLISGDEAELWTGEQLERVMNLGENRIGMRILRLARSPAVPRFPHS